VDKTKVEKTRVKTKLYGISDRWKWVGHDYTTIETCKQLIKDDAMTNVTIEDNLRSLQEQKQWFRLNNMITVQGSYIMDRPTRKKKLYLTEVSAEVPAEVPPEVPPEVPTTVLQLRSFVLRF
jgi:hypothetical protein